MTNENSQEQQAADLIPSTNNFRILAPENLAFMAIILSILAFLVSLVSLLIQWQGYNSTVSEIVSISVTPHSSSTHLRLIPFDLNDENSNGLVETDGEITISNNGGRKISINQYEVRKVKNYKKNRTEGFHIGLQGGLYEVSGSEVFFPIYLEPGESRILHARVGIMVPLDSFRRVKSITQMKGIEKRALLDAIEDGGFDLHGNPVKVQRFKGGGVLKEFSDKPNELPQLLFRVRTGQDNEFWTESEWALR